MRRMIRIITLLMLTAAMLLTVAACGKNEQPSGGSESPSGAATDSQTPPSDTSPSEASPDETPDSVTTDSEAPPVNTAIAADREGNLITLPDTIDTIISMGPSNSEILVELGFADKIIAADEYSFDVAGLPAGIPLFSMMSPDGEQIISLNPDVLFVTGMSKAGGDDPFKAVSDAGICVIYIPSSESIAAIEEDIRFIASVMGVQAKGGAIVAKMEIQMDSIRQLAASITDKKTVYFEISAAPYMYSFGKGVFLNELIDIIGAENILADQDSWLSVTDEMVLSKNPDIILTSVYYIDDPVGEILARPGWDAVTAVQNGDVYKVDANASNRPSQNIITALREMAAVIYPDIFG